MRTTRKSLGTSQWFVGKSRKPTKRNEKITTLSAFNWQPKLALKT